MTVFDQTDFSAQDKLEPKYIYKPKTKEWKAGFAVGHSIGHADGYSDATSRYIPVDKS